MMNRLLALLLVAGAVPLAAQGPGISVESLSGGTVEIGDESARVNALFSDWNRTDTPGAAVLVLKDGRVVHSKGYGLASLEHGVPIRPNTVFDIASVSKQFGAMAIALLEADGRVALDDDVRTYIPELPDFGHTITLRHLVHHTSGLRDWPGTLRIAGWDYQDVTSFEQILRMAMNQKELNFRPGAEYAYSNTGYNLLAEVVQRVAGTSFRAFTDERMFRPLGMSDTHFHDDYSEVVRNRASAYRPVDGGYAHVTDNLTALASSSLFTTVEDLARWALNYDHATVGGPQVVARTHEQGVLNDGEVIAYAFGQSVGEHRGLKRVSHGGSWAGFRTTLERYPDDDLTIIILANRSDFDRDRLAGGILDIYLPGRVGPRETVAGGGGNGDAEPTATWAPTPAELRAYEGVYRSEELLTEWKLEARDGELVAWHFRTGEHELEPVAKDVFRGAPFGEVRFARARGREVEAFTANSVRIRGLRFERVR